MSQILDTVLLFALPASGKSEVRRYLEYLPAERCKEEMHIGPTLQLDDYPYVYLMHRVDDELRKLGGANIFYGGPHRPFLDPFTWGTLIHLLNEDYADLMAGRIHQVPSAAQQMFDRFDRAREKVELPRSLDQLTYRIRCQLADTLEAECRRELEIRNKTCSHDPAGHTIIIEAARGGPNGSAFPITPPRGYDYSISQFSEQILDRAGILYVWVTPEESRRKNIERGRPDGLSSILHHSVPMEVMLGEYGCDDMEYLIKQSERPNSVKVERIVEQTAADGTRRYAMKRWYLPVARFDNRADLTTFVREDRATWAAHDVERIHSGLQGAFATLAQMSAK